MPPRSKIAESMILHCHAQQKLTGKKDCVVSYVIPGKWPRSGKKRLCGKYGGPLGECLAEYEHDVLCAFKADEVIAFLAQFLPVLTVGSPLP